MSKTHRRLSPSPASPARGAAPWSSQPFREHGVGRRMPRDHELRLELQTLFDDEPDGASEGGDEVWRWMGLDPAALCIGDDGLMRLTVV
jgi:hypothetical protein